MQLGAVLVEVDVGVADVSIATAWTRTEAGACKRAAFNAHKAVALMVASVVVNKEGKTKENQKAERRNRERIFKIPA